MGDDLKLAKDMVPQLKKEGYQRWHNSIKTVGDMLEWYSILMDLSLVYDISAEGNKEKADRTVAWLLMKRTIEGHEDLIEVQIQSGTNDFNLALKNLHSEFNRATTGHVNTLMTELFTMTMAKTQTGVREFTALIVRRANQLKELH